MKKRVALIACLVTTMVSPTVRAEGSLSDAQLQAIQTNCVSAQIILQRVRESDRVARVGRGYQYGALLKLMTNFNSRVVQNKLDAPVLITVASDFEKAFETFRTDYTSYDGTLESIGTLDCKQEPTTFYDNLESLRSKRSSLSDQIKNFDTLFDKYQKGIDAIKAKQGGAL